MECENYRGISFLNTSYKILSNVILNKVQLCANEIIEDYQMSFTQGMLIVDQIHSIKQIKEKIYEIDQDIFPKSGIQVSL